MYVANTVVAVGADGVIKVCTEPHDRPCEFGERAIVIGHARQKAAHRLAERRIAGARASEVPPVAGVRVPTYRCRCRAGRSVPEPRGRRVASWIGIAVKLRACGLGWMRCWC